MAETGATGGQAGTEPEVGTTVTAPEGQAQGESVAPVQTTVSGTEAGDVESFFDYESIKGTDLEPAYKQMQKAFSSKTLALKDGTKALEEHAAFMANPLESVKQLAQSMGWNLVQGPQDGEGQPQKQYKSWDDVMVEAEKRRTCRLVHDGQ